MAPSNENPKEENGIVEIEEEVDDDDDDDHNIVVAERGVLEIEEEFDNDDDDDDDEKGALLTSRKNKSGNRDTNGHGKTNATTTTSISSGNAWLCRRLGVLAVVVILAVFLLDWTSIVSFREEGEQSEETGIMEWLKASTASWSSNPKKTNDHNVALARRLHQNVSEALQRLRNDVLRPDYGDHVDIVFTKSVLFQALHVPSTRSLTRLKRKLWLKVLQANLIDYSPKEEKKTRFTWITAGHSTAAGHGNLFHQTSSARLEEAAASVFAAAHIEFRAKNYAMGGYASHPELALCMESIFGFQDVDVLSWDFGMTDGAKDLASYHFWMQRAAVHAQFPVVWNNGDVQSRPYQVHPYYDDHGIATLSLVGWTELYKLFPDCQTLAQKEVEALPPAVAWFMCKGYTEAEACEAHKWGTLPLCDSKKYQSSWHTGWRVHLFVGRVQAVILSELLLEVLAEAAQLTDNNDEDDNNKDKDKDEQGASIPRITNATRQGPTAVDLETWNQNQQETSTRPSLSLSFWSLLRQWEREDAQLFRASSIPEETTDAALYGTALRSRSYCHSALLPSQARFDGLVLAHGLSLQKAPPGHYEYGGMYTNYDMGWCTEQDVNEMEHEREPKNSNCTAAFTGNDGEKDNHDDDHNDDEEDSEGTTMKKKKKKKKKKKTKMALPATPFRVMYDPGAHNVCPYPVVFERDFPEAFLIREEDGWTGGWVPNVYEWAASNAAHVQSNTASFGVEEDEGVEAVMVQLCTKQCPWGKCPDKWVLANETGHDISIRVNGMPVQRAVQSQRNCYFLLKEEDKKKKKTPHPPHLWEVQDSIQTMVEIRLHVKLRFLVTSIIVLTVPNVKSVTGTPQEKKEEG